jgi:hypothetical protein
VGVERAVTRWYVLRQQLQQEVAILQSQLEQAQQENGGVAKESAEIEPQLAAARARLLALGPCPKPMMG